MFDLLSKKGVFDTESLTDEEKKAFDLIYPDWNIIPTMLNQVEMK